jgi:hypothetical protein
VARKPFRAMFALITPEAEYEDAGKTRVDPARVTLVNFDGLPTGETKEEQPDRPIHELASQNDALMKEHNSGRKTEGAGFRLAGEWKTEGAGFRLAFYARGVGTRQRVENLLQWRKLRRAD